VGNDSLLLIFYYYIMYVYFLVQLLIIVFPGCIWAGLNVIVPNFIFGNFSKMREDFVKKKKKKKKKTIRFHNTKLINLLIQTLDQHVIQKLTT